MQTRFSHHALYWYLLALCVGPLACNGSLLPVEALLDHVTGVIPPLHPDTLSDPDATPENLDVGDIPAVPALISASPNTGAPEGHEIVTLFGIGLDETESIYFGENKCESFSVISHSQVLVTTPSHASGLVSIEVVLEDGTSLLRKNVFLYAAPLEIHSIFPESGSAQGGTLLEIKGAEFSEGSFAVLGGKLLINPQWVDENTLLAVAPMNEAGVVDLVISNGQDSKTLQGGFRYWADPIVHSLSPWAGPVEGGNTLTLTGENLNGIDEVWVDGQPGVIEYSLSPESLTLTVPSGTSGPASIGLIGGFGEQVFPDMYTYLTEGDTPSIANITPAAGLPGMIIHIVLQGHDGTTPESVLFGEMEATVFSVEGAVIGVEVPLLAPGPVDVQVTVGETVLGAPNAFLVETALTITGVEPAEGPMEGGTQITLTGSGFSQENITLFVGALPVQNLEVLDENTLTAITSPGTVGLAQIRIEKGISLAYSPTPFEYILDAGIFAYAISPSVGSIAGGTYVEVFGSGFEEGTTVTLGEDTVVDLVVHSSAHLSFYTPPSTLVTTMDFQVELDGASHLLPSAFTYYNPTSELGGTWGGPVQNTVNISVLDGTTFIPIQSASVILNSDSLAWPCTTDQNGHCTFSAPSLDGPCNASAYKASYSATTLEEFDAKNATIFLYPQVPPQPPQPSMPESDNPPILSGKVTGLDKFAIPPAFTCEDLGVSAADFETGHCSPCTSGDDCEGSTTLCTKTLHGTGFCSSSCASNEDCPAPFVCGGSGGSPQCMLPTPEKAAFCTTSQTELFYGFSPAGPALNNPVDEDSRYAFAVVPIPLAVVCYGGFLLADLPADIFSTGDPIPNFYPTVMGIRRNVFPIDGQTVDAQDVELNIPLTRILETELYGFPTPPELPDGYTSISDTHELFLQIELQLNGIDGVIPMPSMPIGTLHPDNRSPTLPIVIQPLAFDKSEAPGPQLQFPFYPEGLEGPLAGATFNVRAQGSVSVHSYDNALTEVVIREAPDLNGVPALLWDHEAQSWSPMSVGSNEAVRDIATSTEGVTIAVGDHGLILQRSGSEWWKQSPVTASNLRGIQATDSGGFLAVGDAGTLLSFTGLAWIPENIGFEDDFHDVWVDDSGTVWIAGTASLYRKEGGEWQMAPLLHSADLHALEGTATVPLIGAGTAGKVVTYIEGEWLASVPLPNVEWHSICTSEAGAIALVGAEGNVLLGTPGNWESLQLEGNSSIEACVFDSGNVLWVAGGEGTVAQWVDGSWNTLSVPELGTVVHAMELLDGMPLAMGHATKLIGPFLDYPEWITPANADTTLGEALIWEVPLAPTPSFTQITFTPCEFYLPWYFLVDGPVGFSALADFSELGLEPSTFQGYLLYLNHRRSNVAFDMDHFLMAVDMQKERVEAESSRSSRSANCFF